MKIKVSEASEAILDGLVAMTENVTSREFYLFYGEDGRYKYSTNWELAGPIIEKHIYRIEDYGDAWEAEGPNGIRCRGETVLIAAMRAFVASMYGDEVEVPEELL